MASNATSSTNITNSDQCTYATCSIKVYGEISYRPSLGGNAFFLSLFAVALMAQIVLGIRFRTWTYLVSMIGGLTLEIVGYAGRIMLYNNVFNLNNFVIYLVGLTIGPAFFSAAIYLTLSRVIAIYGTKLSYFRGKTITRIFIACDFVSLVLQSAGGAIVATADTKTTGNLGRYIMIAGLAWQVCTTTIFVVLCVQFAWSIHSKPHEVNPNSASIRRSQPFRLFLLAMTIATIMILVRCSFRVAELQYGFDSSLANNQVAFMILDGAMMIIAASCLTFAHPGLLLGEVWNITRSKGTMPHAYLDGESAEEEMKVHNIT